MAAGKLYLRDSNTKSVSGFSIEANYFITVVHWETLHLAGIGMENNGLARISQARSSIYGTSPLYDYNLLGRIISSGEERWRHSVTDGLESQGL